MSRLYPAAGLSATGRSARRPRFPWGRWTSRRDGNIRSGSGGKAVVGGGAGRPNRSPLYRFRAGADSAPEIQSRFRPRAFAGTASGRPARPAPSCPALPDRSPPARTWRNRRSGWSRPIRISANRARTRSRLTAAASARVSGKTSMNSSPPDRPARSTARRLSRRIPPNATRTSSPKWWPCMSLMALKQVDIAEADRQRPAVATGGFHGRLEQLEQVAPVEHAGELVVGGVPPQLFLHPLPFRHVLRDLDDADDAPVAAADRRNGRLLDIDLPVLLAVVKFSPPLPAALDRLPQRGNIRGIAGPSSGSGDSGRPPPRAGSR